LTLLKGKEKGQNPIVRHGDKPAAYFVIEFLLNIILYFLVGLFRWNCPPLSKILTTLIN